MMIRAYILVLLLLCGVRTGFAGNIEVPWAQFSQLYQESIEKQVRDSLPKLEKPPMYSLEESICFLRLSNRTAEVEMQISGSVIAGQIDQIPLLEHPVNLHAVQSVEGGHLIHAGPERRLLAFRPEGVGPFRIHLSFLVTAEEDRHARFVTFPTPPALKNTLHIEKNDDLKLMHIPGVVSNGDGHFFTSRSSLTVRFADSRTVARRRNPMIDVLSKITMKGRRVMIRSVFLPVEPFSDTFAILIPHGFRYAAASLAPNTIVERKDQKLEVRPHPAREQVFHVDFISTRTFGDTGIEVNLPHVDANEGAEGRFILLSADNAMLALDKPDSYEQIPSTRLPSRLQSETEGVPMVFHRHDQATIRVQTVYFAEVATPALVLDRLSFFTAVEENGSSLSVMDMELPAGTGDHLGIKPVTDTHIWYLRVNGIPHKVYTDENQNWLVPLPSGEAAHIELAFHRRNPKLGLHGRLDAVLPAFDIPCREVVIGIALPERIRLVSFEGPVSPSPGLSPKAPEEFIGRPHFFKGAFYRGEGMAFSLMYEEPVRDPSTAN